MRSILSCVSHRSTHSKDDKTWIRWRQSIKCRIWEHPSKTVPAPTSVFFVIVVVVIIFVVDVFVVAVFIVFVVIVLLLLKLRLGIRWKQSIKCKMSEDRSQTVPQNLSSSIAKAQNPSKGRCSKKRSFTSDSMTLNNKNNLANFFY